MARLRIVFPFSGIDIGGSHVATFALAQAMREQFGRECLFIVASGTPIAIEAERLGFKVIDSGELEAANWEIRKRRSPIYAARRLLARWKIMRGIGRCIVHCNEIIAIQSYGLIGKAMGGKMVYHHHALNRMILPNRILISAADAVVAVSEGCRLALDWLGPSKLQVILNPIEVGTPERAAAKARLAKALNVDSGKIWMGFAGNFWRRKRPEFFLEAAAEILRAEPRAHFILFGRRADYEIEDLQAQAAALGITEQVTFAGFLMPPEDNIAAVDYLLAPAIDEPFGRTPIEAALLDTPYVATDDAGHAEIGARWGGGRMVPIEATPSEFAGVVLDVMKDPKAIRASDVEKARIRTDFSLPAHAAAIEAIYRRIESSS